jgi:hypothetical protein
MAYFAEKTYNSGTDRLFLVYYALPEAVINQNGWGVDPNYIADNIQSFIGKPAVLKRKDPNNPLDVAQKGNFVHPMVQRGAGVRDVMEYQENWAIGRVHRVSLNPDKGWRFDIEITDPKAKDVMKSEEHIDQYPPYVSPLILSFPHQNPNEDPKSLKHWLGAHIAFVDYPAYGFDRMDIAGKCYGSEQECQVMLHNASEMQTACNFCITDATLQLIGSSSSQVSQSDISSSNNTMSANTNTAQPTPQNVTTVTKTPTVEVKREQVVATNTTYPNTPTFDDKNKPAEPQPEPTNNPPTNDKPSSEGEGVTEESPKSLDEAKNVIKSLQSVVSELTAQQAKTNKFMAQIQREKRLAELRNIVPRQLFKSPDKYNEELERVYNWQGISDTEIAEVYQSKLMNLTVAPKAASSAVETSREQYGNFKAVPEFHKAAGEETSNKTDSSQSSFMTHYRLMKRIVGGSV